MAANGGGRDPQGPLAYGLSGRPTCVGLRVCVRGDIDVARCVPKEHPGLRRRESGRDARVRQILVRVPETAAGPLRGLVLEAVGGKHSRQPLGAAPCRHDLGDQFLHRGLDP